jgi:uncharacterized membrane protein YdjX (TVP38/TMEM64 family)
VVARPLSFSSQSFIVARSLARSFRLKALAKRADANHVRTSRRQIPRTPLSDLPWKKIATVALVAGGIAALAGKLVDIEAIHAEAARLNGAIAFALLLVLPLVGFPASVLHVAAGIRFGVMLGLTLVSLSILIQLLVSYTVVRLWRKRFENARWVKKIRERIPRGAHASVCVCTVLLPGAPFAAVNYVLPLIGVPLRTFILCAWPLHTLRATVTVAFGGQSAHLTAARLAVLIAYALMILGACWWTYRRLQSRFEGQRPAAGGRKQRA